MSFGPSGSKSLRYRHAQRERGTKKRHSTTHTANAADTCTRTRSARTHHISKAQPTPQTNAGKAKRTKTKTDLYATSLLHRFTTARKRETCARQLSHAG
eukprot:7161157-Prymnesium_polylepis.1